MSKGTWSRDCFPMIAIILIPVQDPGQWDEIFVQTKGAFPGTGLIYHFPGS